MMINHQFIAIYQDGTNQQMSEIFGHVKPYYENRFYLY